MGRGATGWGGGGRRSEEAGAKEAREGPGWPSVFGGGSGANSSACVLRRHDQQRVIHLPNTHPLTLHTLSHSTPQPTTGKSFFKKKKQPIPVDLKATDFTGGGWGCGCGTLEHLAACLCVSMCVHASPDLKQSERSGAGACQHIMQAKAATAAAGSSHHCPQQQHSRAFPSHPDTTNSACPPLLPPSLPAYNTGQVKAAVEATYMVPPSGTCISVRVARSSMQPEAVAANTLAALQGVVKHIPKKWANVQVGCCVLCWVLGVLEKGTG